MYYTLVRGPDDVKQLYTSSRSNGQSWYFQGTQDARLKIGGAGGSFILNVDGSYSLTQNNNVFLSVLTNDQSGVLGLNQIINSARGYMLNSRDWNCVEAHLYLFIDPAYNNTDIPISIGFHGANPESRIINRCLGVGYQAQLFTSGKTRFAKSLWYPSGFVYSEPRNVVDPLPNRWVGFKATCITVKKGMVKMQIFVDNGNLTNNWIPVHTITDSGGWGGQGINSVIASACGGSSDQVFDFGGPVVTFKWQNLGSGPSTVKIRKPAVREVNPAISINDPVIQQTSRHGSRKPKYGVQPENDSQFYPDSENFQTTDPVTTP